MNPHTDLKKGLMHVHNRLQALIYLTKSNNTNPDYMLILLSIKYTYQVICLLLFLRKKTQYCPEEFVSAFKHITRLGKLIKLGWQGINPPLVLVLVSLLIVIFPVLKSHVL